MRRFLYYIPGLSGGNAQTLRDRGLLSRFTQYGGSLIEHGFTAIDGGPAGGGVIVAAGPNPPDLVGSPPAAWIEGEKFWCAIEDAQLPPRPADLARDVGLGGYEIELAGNRWRVPLVHRWDDDRLEHVPNFPRTLAYVNEGGRMRTRAMAAPEHRAIDELASKLFSRFAAEASVPIDELFADAVALLAKNYRLGLEEASLLGLLDVEAALEICGAAIDLPSLKRAATQLSLQGLSPAEPVLSEE